MSSLISIIVPIYKVEAYLDRCVNSIVNQTYKNLEIILVDDGSPDRCPELCDAWAKKDTRIKVIHKSNGGLSDARNAGLKVATGELIAFVDSDDWLHYQALEIMGNELIKNNVDVIACNYLKTAKPKNMSNYNLNSDFSVRLFSDKEAMECLLDDRFIKTIVWNKLYRREIIQNILFEIGKYNEDEFYTYQVIGRCKRIAYIDIELYYYYQRVDSIMGKYTLKHLDALEGMYRRLEYIKTRYDYLYDKAKLSFLIMLVMHCRTIKAASDIENEAKQEAIRRIQLYRKRIVFHLKDIINCNVKEKIYIILSHFSISVLCDLLMKG